MKQKVKNIKKQYDNLSQSYGFKPCLFLILYTICFFIASNVLISVFVGENKSFVWKMDGMAQHIVALKYIRSYIINFFTKGSLPLMDFSIGQGFDVIGTLNYYGFGDPTTLFTVFFSENYVEEMYQFLIFLKLYLCGIGFAYFCRVLGKRNIEAVLPASLSYAFCNYVLLGGMRHPLFLNGVMYLPLILAGVEKIIQKKKIGLLCIAVALSFSSNYYFTYMNTLMAAIYFFIRQIGIYRMDGIKGFLSKVGKVMLSYLWGIGISAAIMFPALYAFLQNSRGESLGLKPSAFYEPEYYDRFLESFFVSFRTVNKWTVPGIGILGCFAFFIVLIRWKKEERRLIIAFLVGIAMLSFPWAGKIMNGFSYVSTRFSYGMAFLLALVLVCAINDIKELKKVRLGILCLCSAIMFGYCKYKESISFMPVMFQIAAILILVTILFIVIYVLNLNFKHAHCLLYIFTIIAMVNLSYNFNTVFSSTYYNYSQEFVERGQVLNIMNNGVIQALGNIEDDSFYRTERDREYTNRTLFYNIPGATYYYSVVPNSINELYRSTCVANYHLAFELNSLEKRTGLDALAGVKYFASRYSKYAPYGFSRIKLEMINDQKIYLFKNNFALPLGVTYDSYMTKEQYNNLEPEEREQALLTSAVTNEKISGIENFDSEIAGITIIEPTISDAQHVRIEKNKMTVGSKGQFKFLFNGLEDCETYVVFKNCYVNDNSSDSQGARIRGASGGEKLRIRGNLDKGYFAKDAGIVNLGYSLEPQTYCDVKFSKRREYNFDDYYIACISMKEYEKRVNKLKSESMKNIKIGTNKVTGTVDCSQDKILQLSIPYSIGWKAYVDGKRVDTFSSGVAYTGIKLSKGHHDIKMTYTSPGFLPGVILSIVSCIMLAVYLFFDDLKKQLEKRLSNRQAKK